MANNSSRGRIIGLVSIAVFSLGMQAFGPVPDDSTMQSPIESHARAYLSGALPPAAVVEGIDGASAGPGSGIDSWGAAGINISGIAAGDGESVNNINVALSALPGRLLTQLGNRSLGSLSITVSETGSTLSGFQPYGTAANFFSTQEGRNEVVLFPGQRPQTVLHELGHAFNFRNLQAGKYAQVYLDPEMRSFMSATGWTLQTSESVLAGMTDQALVHTSRSTAQVWTRLSADDPIEDFANSFAAYFVDPAGLARLSPERFEWFVTNIGR